MRLLTTRLSGKEVGRGNSTMGKQSIVATLEDAWDAWEIHFLILLSLFLQVVLFLFAGMRRWSTSTALRTALWLAYLWADSVAIFILGHLAIHATQPGHQLMSFWAPFVLNHLGGQDTITAFSKQDNELWMRHLLNLVTQVGIAGYVVAKASWPDGRLMAAMVIMFVSGCFKYAERTYCLYRASPASLREHAHKKFSSNLIRVDLKDEDIGPNKYSESDALDAVNHIMRLYHDWQNNEGRFRNRDSEIVPDIMAVDAPLFSREDLTSAAEDERKRRVEKTQALKNPCWAYELASIDLAQAYRLLYTKRTVRGPGYNIYIEAFKKSSEFLLIQYRGKILFYCSVAFAKLICLPILVYPITHYASSLIALVLFSVAEKGNHIDTNRADIIVSYILLAGALLLDVLSVAMLFLPQDLGLNFPTISWLLQNLQPATFRPVPRQWSEELAQYSMIKRWSVPASGMVSRVRQWVIRERLLGDWGVEMLEVTHTALFIESDGDKYRSPIQKFILEKLLHSRTKQKQNITSSRGQQALDEWRVDRDKQGVQCSEGLVKSTSDDVGFPTSVLIWHIATEMCYYCQDEDNASSSNSDPLMKEHQQNCRDLSNYIMYLVFKCGVMLTSSSQLLHDKVHREIELKLGNLVKRSEEEAVKWLFIGKKDQAVEEQVRGKEKEKELKGKEILEDPDHSEDEMHQGSSGNGCAASNNRAQELPQSLQALGTPFLPRARKVAQELIGIEDKVSRWDLIASVWSEMLFYTAPRCGASFHYEHLSTGGEFITHVLLLIRDLASFQPTLNE